MQVDRTTLLIDVGNTRVKWCAADAADASPDAVQAIPHADDRFEVALRADLQVRPWQGIWIASVGSAEVLSRIELSCAELLPGIPLQHARSLAQCGDLRNGYDTPSQLGVDRFLALLAARERWPRDRVLHASIGSAVTIDLLERDGMHAGGLIAPAPSAMWKSLSSLAPQLAVHESATPGVFARDTAAGMASGCVLAAAGLIEHCVRAAAASGEPPRLVLSGGGAAELAPRLAMELQVVPYLVLAGLGRYARLQSAGHSSVADQ